VWWLPYTVKEDISGRLTATGTNSEWLRVTANDGQYTDDFYGVSTGVGPKAYAQFPMNIGSGEQYFMGNHLYWQNADGTWGYQHFWSTNAQGQILAFSGACGYLTY
jgi:hypothetical protein